MMVKEFSTQIVAAQERFAMWEEFQSASHMRSILSSKNQDDFCARMRLLSLGDVQISALAHPHLKVVRTSRLVRQGDPEVYHVHFLFSGRGHHAQDGRDSGLRSGQLVVVDSSLPTVGELHTTAGGWSSIIARLPRRLLPLPDKTVRRLIAVPIPGHHGMTGALCRWLTDLHTRAYEFTHADAPALASVTTDLVACALARHLDSEDAMPAEARRRALWLRIRAFIEQHLSDPGLTPDAIAAAHGISTRHLYRLFEENDRTVAAWIRHRRLEHCRHDLANPRLRGRSVHSIAARWGFTDPAHFSRTFRAAYGTSPRDYRHAIWASAVQERNGMQR
ncbi:helix-turn-helix domain-containing protein [Streptomyces capparidis]